MDLPIVKSGTQRATPPTGTGPYVFTEDGYLEAFPLHRDYKSLPTDRVYYSENDLGSLTRAFASKEIDLLNRDTTGVVGLNFHGFSRRATMTPRISSISASTSARAPAQTPSCAGR